MSAHKTNKYVHGQLTHKQMTWYIKYKMQGRKDIGHDHGVHIRNELFN